MVETQRVAVLGDPYAYKRKIISNGLVFYAPLWHPDLSRSSFITKDVNEYSCAVVGAVWKYNGRDFDGNDDHITQATFLDTMLSAFTIEMWVRDEGGAGTTKALFRKLNVTDEDRLWAEISTANGTLWFSTEGNNEGAKGVTGGDLAQDTWYHLVFIYTAGGTQTVYVNLVQGTSTTASTVGDGAQTDMHFGNYDTRDNAWDGTIGEIRVYNRALTPLEIQHNYDVTKGRYQ